MCLAKYDVMLFLKLRGDQLEIFISLRHLQSETWTDPFWSGSPYAKGIMILRSLSSCINDLIHRHQIKLAQPQAAQRNSVLLRSIRSFRFEDEDEALCFRHNEIFTLFRLQLGQDDEVDCNNIVTPSLSRIWACAQWAKVRLGPRSCRRLQI